MSQALVSIIIPCFNAARWLPETVESALAQSWAHREVLVIDDGSRDESLRIARQFESRGVRVFSQANQGASAARNRGLVEAKGDFFQFLDADDLLHPDKIATQVGLLEKREHGTVASGRWGRFAGNPRETRFVDDPVFRDLTAMEFLRLAAHEGHMMHPAAWLTPARVAREAGPWDESLSLNDDGEYFARVLLASGGIAHCAEAQSYYRSGIAGTLSKRSDEKAQRSLFRSMELTASYMWRADPSAETRSALAALYLRLLHELYPAPRNLITDTLRRIDEFGGTVTPPPMGPRSKMLARLIGWKATRRLDALFRR